MKSTNIKILFLSFVLLSAFSLAVTAQAAGDSLYVSPATSTVNEGSNIAVSAVAGTSGDKICAVQGTIIFNNMTCQSITTANGLLVQTSPACSNPSFVLAIPKCTTTDATLFTISSKAGNVGTASISFSGVKLAGVGVVVSTSSIGGNYTVSALPAVVPQPKITAAKAATAKAATKAKTTETNVNQTAAIGTTPGAYLFFGWIWKNIILIIVLIIASVASYIAGRMSCKQNKK